MLRAAAAFGLAGSATAACVPRGQWPSIDGITECMHFAYTAQFPLSGAHQKALVSPRRAIEDLRDQLKTTGLLSEACSRAIANAMCLRYIPACGSDGELLLPCADACDTLYASCATALAAAAALPQVQAQAVRALSSCYEWRSVDHPSCHVFTTAPCLSTAMAHGAGLLPQGSWCPRGISQNETVVSISGLAFTRDPWVHDPNSREAEYAVWPACMFAGMLLALVSVGGETREQVEGESALRKLVGRVRSIRFCSQFLLIIVAGLSGFAVFFLSSRLENDDIQLTFDKANEAHNRSTTLLRDHTYAASAAASAALAERAAASAAIDFVLFAEVHNVTIEHIARTGVDPRPSPLGAPAVFEVFLAGIARSQRLHDVTMSCAVVSLDSADATLLLLEDRAMEMLGPYGPGAGSERHAGFVNQVGKVFYGDGTLSPEDPPEGLSGLQQEVPKDYSTIHARGADDWSTLQQFAGHLVIHMLSTVYAPDGRALANVGTAFDLSKLASHFRGIMKSNRERLAIVRRDSGKLWLMAATHGHLTDSFFAPVTADQSRDWVIAAFFSALDRQDFSLDLSQGSIRLNLTVQEYVTDTYVVSSRRLDVWGLEAYVVAIVPHTVLEEDILLGMGELVERIREDTAAVKDAENEGRRFMVFVVIVIMVFAFLVSFVVSVTLTGGLHRLSYDLHDIAAMQLDRAARSRSVTHPSSLAEVRGMQLYIRRLVSKLLEFRHYLPDLSIVQGERVGDSDSDVDDLDDAAGRRAMITERTCTVRITHLSRKALRQQGKQLSASLAAHSPTAGIASMSRSGGPKGAAGAAKRVSMFEWHYSDPSNASLVDLLKECRAAVGEPPGEPIALIAVVPGNGSGSAFEEPEEYPLVYSHHLKNVLTFSPDELVLVSAKNSKIGLISPLVAVMSVFGKLSLLLVILRMWKSAKSMAVVLGLTLVFSFAINITLAFKLNHKAGRTDAAMRDWTHHFQTETTVVMCLCGFNVQNMLVLWSGLRIGRFLRFHAPMPPPIRNQAIRWSMFSLVVGDIIPLVIVVYFLVSEQKFAFDSLLAVAAQTGAILASSVKKFVVFCLVDDEAQREAQRTRDAKLRALERIRKLSPVTAAVVRVRLTDFNELVEVLEPPRLSELVCDFYEQVSVAVKQNRGTATRFSEGWVEAMFNYPIACSGAERLACSAVAQVLHRPPPREIESLRDGGSAAGWITASVVAGEFLSGNLGIKGGRKLLHCIGWLANISPMLCNHNTTLVTRALVDQSVATALDEQAKRGHGHAGEFIVRPVDILVPPGRPEQMTVYQLIPVRGLDQSVSLALAGNMYTYNSAFSLIEKDNLEHADRLLRSYIEKLRPVRDHVAEALAARLQAAGSLANFVGDDTRIAFTAADSVAGRNPRKGSLRNPNFGSMHVSRIARSRSTPMSANIKLLHLPSSEAFRVTSFQLPQASGGSSRRPGPPARRHSDIWGQDTPTDGDDVDVVTIAGPGTAPTVPAPPPQRGAVRQGSDGARPAEAARQHVHFSPEAPPRRPSPRGAPEAGPPSGDGPARSAEPRWAAENGGAAGFVAGSEAAQPPSPGRPRDGVHAGRPGTAQGPEPPALPLLSRGSATPPPRPPELPQRPPPSPAAVLPAKVPAGRGAGGGTAPTANGGAERPARSPVPDRPAHSAGAPRPPSGGAYKQNGRPFDPAVPPVVPTPPASGGAAGANAPVRISAGLRLGQRPAQTYPEV
eukprot:TRINITY_DN18086_c1_g1_i1.p1 TRINITY_DN18086_c1_g1~~TRINITY_DN18086_c1_g1_i1.p1  ORF type:complete len:1714 (+),score=399.97 TRINITY_DN18086_c1_g1_i1:81-5222(+)